jgi:uncharacterized repeat protein (TIGR02543 family)
MRQITTPSTTETARAHIALRVLLAVVLALSGLFLATPVWADEDNGVTSGDYAGNPPVLNVGEPIVLEPTEQSAYFYDFMNGVAAFDLEDINLTAAVTVTEPGTDHAPTVDTSVVGVYPINYSVTDSDLNRISATRLVIVNDGRYELIDEYFDGDIDVVIGAKGFVVRATDCVFTPEYATIQQAKSLSFVEAYSAQGANLTTQVGLVSGMPPQGYANRAPGDYSFTWTVPGYPAVAKETVGSIIGDEFSITPIDTTSAYAIVARDFLVHPDYAANITTEADFIYNAQARVIKLLASAANRPVTLVDSGGFGPVQGIYPITFGATGIPTSKLSLTINGTATGGAIPTLSLDWPIKIPINYQPGAPAIDAARIIEAGHITAVDTDIYDQPDPDIADYIEIIDAATGRPPAIPADQPGVYQVRVKIVDADANAVEAVVAVIIDDGNFSFTAPRADHSGFILRAHGFDIDLRDVTPARLDEQIREQSEAQAWRNDGVRVTAEVISTGGYRDIAGTYSPVIGIHDAGGPSPVLDPVLSRSISVNVVDTYLRYRVTFDANGGTLTGPNVITVVEPATHLPYLPASPIRAGYTFTGWFTQPADGTQLTAETPVTADITYFAQWERVAWAVTLDATGGTVTPPAVTRVYGAMIGDLPQPTRTGYTFTGWFTEASGGIPVAPETPVMSDITLYAHWERAVTQYEGGDRQDTAARASAKAYPDPSRVDSVILAYSYDFPDALAASYLAGALGAPILLCDTNKIPAGTVAELNRLRPATIYIVGGIGVISEGVESALISQSLAPAVIRLGGAGREETAYRIASEAKSRGTAPVTAFVVDAGNFPDALSAGSLSAGQGVPILLTATGTLDGWTRQFLEESGIADIIVVGGTGSVSEEVAAQLGALPSGPTVTRWAGPDRYATSKAVLDGAIAKWGLNPTLVGLASGADFPDALVGGAAVGSRGGLLAITDPDALSVAATETISTYKDSLADVEIFGGPGTIRVADEVQKLLG